MTSKEKEGVCSYGSEKGKTRRESETF
jgi:hypothetical protein